MDETWSGEGPEEKDSLGGESCQEQFRIHLPGLLKVLAENLYSNRKVAVRELLQNAHDSCVRRAVEGREDHYSPRIHVSVDVPRRTITIEDNGSGLSPEDVREYLATIGRSYTRELGERLALLSPDEASRLIGQFGLGFLSAFLIASEVTLVTRALKEGSQALRWRSAGDVHYELTPSVRKEVGTTVLLKIKPGASFLLGEEILNETIQQYADFLPIPIYVADSPLPANLMKPPWDTDYPEAAAREYIERVFKQPDPLCIIPLSDASVDLGHDRMTVPLKGFLFVPPSSVASVREYGDLVVYIRQMFICDRQRDLLPPWARFVRGVIDCPYLQPTASREEIHQDDNFTFVQQALEDQLLAGLRQIALQDPPTWRKIVHGHSDIITGWAVRDNEFFEQVADIVTFRTSRGPISLPDYLELTGGAIYYVTRELGSLQEQLLGEGHGVPVVDASWFAVTPFLQKYVDHREGVQLVQLDGESRQMLTPIPESRFSTLLDYYRERGVRARMVSFKPEEVPALVIYPRDAEFVRESRQALEAGELPLALAGLVGDYIKKAAEDEDNLKGTLYLNASCSLVQRLASEPAGRVSTEPALRLIFQVARLFSGRMMTPADAARAFGEAVSAIEELL